MTVQAIAVLTTVAYSAVVTLAIFMIIKYTVGLRVSADDEYFGVDQSEHGEKAYNI